MIAQHEVQHDETMLITHQIRAGAPVLAAPAPGPAPADASRLPAEVLVPGGPFTMGTSTEPWALDNERPAHTVDVAPFYIDTTPVTCGAYAEFIADGGYGDPRWWTGAGWEHRQRAGLSAPMYWSADGGQWARTAFGKTEPVRLDEPVRHVCWYEADAYARWAGRRLPTEAEWEKAARFDPATGLSRRYPWGNSEPQAFLANLGQEFLRPAPAGSYPAGAAPCGARQLIGDVWEWTSSDFLPYPGFAAWPYREYSEVFFGPEYKVLRGGSFAVSPVACRGTFRNWDYPIRRQAAGLAATLPTASLLELEARVDSALVWALVLHRLRAGLAPAEALADTIGALRAAGVTGRFNFLLTDGRVIAATAAGHTLYYRQAVGGVTVTVASEPADDEPGWIEVPGGSVVSACRRRVRDAVVVDGCRRAVRPLPFRPDLKGHRGRPLSIDMCSACGLTTGTI